MGNAMLGDQLENLGRIDLAQRRNSSGRGDGQKAPAVQWNIGRVEMDRMLAGAGEDITDGIQIKA